MNLEKIRVKKMSSEPFKQLITYLKRVPSIKSSIGTGMEEGHWWVKFSINLNILLLGMLFKNLDIS